MRRAAFCPIAFIGGSLTVGCGASNTAVTSWRRLFMRYVYERIVSVYDTKVGEINAAIGAMKSVGSVFMLERNVLPKQPVLAFVEEIINDRPSPDKLLVRKSVEGIIRRLKSHPQNPDIVLLGAGVRPGKGDREDGLLDHSLHREIADHYGVAFLDIQSHILETLESRGQAYDAVTIGDWDDLHVNDYGNHLWFECLRDWFEEQVGLYDKDPAARPDTALPEPHTSDELQYTKLIDPTRRNKSIRLEGGWEKGGDKVITQWYLDNVLVGRPGDKLTFTFEGTAIGTLSHVHNNGLKLEAKVDGEEVVGPFTNYLVDFGNFDMICHGMPYGEHVLELTVGEPMKRQNQLEDPTARVAYLGVGGKK
jgi:lysophospholipase L1-like esterase